MSVPSGGLRGWLAMRKHLRVVLQQNETKSRVVLTSGETQRAPLLTRCAEQQEGKVAEGGVCQRIH